MSQITFEIGDTVLHKGQLAGEPAKGFINHIYIMRESIPQFQGADPWGKDWSIDWEADWDTDVVEVEYFSITKQPNEDDDYIHSNNLFMVRCVLTEKVNTDFYT